ncbi:MAG: DUF6159 family protein [Methanobacteriota archaeon]
MGMFGRGWDLTKLSFRVIRKDKELLVLPLISGITTLVLWGTFFGYVWFFNIFDSTGVTLYLTVALGFVFYLLTNFIIIFFNAAVVGAAMIRLNGGDPTVSDGIRVAASRIKEILMWALFAATVSLILRAIAEKGGIIGKIVSGIAGMAWSIATYFVVPILIYEGLTPWKAVKRSVAVLRGAWGEALIGNMGTGLIFFLLAIVGIVPLALGILSQSLIILVVCVFIAVAYWIFIAVLSSAVESVLLAALYRYAVTGKLAEDFAGSVPPPQNVVSGAYGMPPAPGA